MTMQPARVQHAFVLTAFALLAGCTTATTDEPGAPTEEPTAQAASALGAFDPCSSEWQLPTWDRQRDLLSPDPAFVAFEDRLEAGGARWIGSHDLPKPYRAIVLVDTYLDGTKKDPRSALWYLASLPVGAKDARNAVREFHAIEPVRSRELGYCLADGTFLPNHGWGPGNVAVKQVIVQYDPRCVCVAESVRISTWVDRPNYEETPAY
jgi:hypothetical protein